MNFHFGGVDMLKQFRKDRCYIIAEIGGNFTNFDQARRLIDEASACGVDAIKIQTYKADTLSSKHALFDMENTGVTSQYELFKKYEVDESLHRQIFDYIESKQLDWFSTPSHEEDIELLERLGVSSYKIGSDDAVNIPLLKYVAKIGKPVLLSTGMCTLEEVKFSVSKILEEGNENLMLLHCVTSYPTHPKDVNLRAIQTLRREFPEFVIGYSDHSIGTTACICAAAMGAQIIEKHFTYDKSEVGPDHQVSADPKEMKEIVDAIRTFEIMRGSGIKRPADSENTTRVNNRKSVVVVKPLKQGDYLTRDHLDIKRPGYGVPPKDLEYVLGRSVKRDLQVDDVLMWEDI